MNILLVIHQFLPQYASGTEILTYTVAKELKRQGHQVSIFTAHPHKGDRKIKTRFDQYQYKGITVYRFHHQYAVAEQQPMVELSFANQLAEKYFKKILRQLKPDIIHIFHLDRLGTGLIDIAVKEKIPAFMTPTDFWLLCPISQLFLCNNTLCHGPTTYAGNCIKHMTEMKNIRYIKHIPSFVFEMAGQFTNIINKTKHPYAKELHSTVNRLKRNMNHANKLHKVLSPTTFMTKKLTTYGINENIIQQIAFGIDTHKKTTHQIKGPKNTKIRLGYIGTLAPHKGCHVLIKAVLSFSPQDLILTIYGSTKDFPEYTRQITEDAKNNRNIIFAETFDNHQIEQIINTFDVLVVPSIWYENTPLVVYSAQAFHCPVIASNLPGLSETIHHDINGLLFETGNVNALKHQIKRIIQEKSLLEKLTNNSIIPKNTQTYVDELLKIWRENLVKMV